MTNDKITDEHAARLGMMARRMYETLTTAFEGPADAVLVLCEVLAMITAFQRGDDVPLDDSINDTCDAIRELSKLYENAKLKTAD